MQTRGGRKSKISATWQRNGSWFQHLIEGDTIDSIDRLRERINEIFVSLATDFILLSRQSM